MNDTIRFQNEQERELWTEVYKKDYAAPAFNKVAADEAVLQFRERNRASDSTEKPLVPSEFQESLLTEHEGTLGVNRAPKVIPMKPRNPNEV